MKTPFRTIRPHKTADFLAAPLRQIKKYPYFMHLNRNPVLAQGLLKVSSIQPTINSDVRNFA